MAATGDSARTMLPPSPNQSNQSARLWPNAFQQNFCIKRTISLRQWKDQQIDFASRAQGSQKDSNRCGSTSSRANAVALAGKLKLLKTVFQATPRKKSFVNGA